MIVLVMAMLAKPSAMVIPVIVAALDRWVMGRSWKKVLVSAGGWGLAVLPLVIVARMAQMAEGVAEVAWWQQPLIAGDALAFYLWKLVWPVDLGADYGRRPAVVMGIMGGVWIYLAWMVPAIVGWLARWGMRRNEKLEVGSEKGQLEIGVVRMGGTPMSRGSGGAESADGRGIVRMGGTPTSRGSGGAESAEGRGIVRTGGTPMSRGSGGGAESAEGRGIARMGGTPMSRGSLLTVGMVVFAAGLLPVLGFAPFMFQYMSTVADHYVYVGMLGVGMGVTWGVMCVSERIGGPSARNARSGEGSARRWAMGVGCAVMVGVLGWKSFSQVGVWKDDLTLWRHTMAISPHSFVAPNNVAANYGRRSVILSRAAEEARERGREDLAANFEAERVRALEMATRMLERSVAINPDYPTARQNAVMNYMRLGRAGPAVAHLEGLFKANEVAPPLLRDNYTAYHDTAGHLYMRLGNYEKAAEHFEMLAKLVPGHATAGKDLGAARERMREARVEGDDVIRQ